MNLATIFIIILTLLILIFSKDKEYHMFLMACCLGLYTNLGSFMNVDIFDSFTREYFVLVILIILKIINLVKNKNIMLNKKLVLSIGFMVLSILIGFISLLFIPIKPYIAPMDVTYDAIVLEDIPLSLATFKMNNIAAFILFGIFLISILLCREYFYKEEYVNRTIEFLLLTIKIFFAIMIIEALIVNVFHIDGFRKMVMGFFGAVDNDKIYSYSTVRFLGLKSAFAFYTEPSYVSGPLLVFYLINYVRGSITKNNLLLFFISAIVAVLSGSTNCIIALVFGIFVLFKMLIKDEKITKKNKMIIFYILLLFILILLLIFNDAQIWNKGFNKVYDKLKAYFTATKTKNASTISGYIRSYGNSVCYNVLKTNPLFGAGLGTTRGYGFVPSMIATLGIVGSILLVNFYRVAFNIKITKKKIIPFIALIAILTGFYSASHMYSFIVISIFISFNNYAKNKGGKQTICQEEKN